VVVPTKFGHLVFEAVDREDGQGWYIPEPYATAKLSIKMRRHIEEQLNRREKRLQLGAAWDEIQYILRRTERRVYLMLVAGAAASALIGYAAAALTNVLR